MAQGDGGEDECVNAFKSGNKHMAEQLLPHTRPANVRTTFPLVRGVHVVAMSMVSLLHIAAYWGWTSWAGPNHSGVYGWLGLRRIPEFVSHYLELGLRRLPHKWLN